MILVVPLAMTYGILITGWVTYFLVHSLLAADSVKRAAFRLVSPRGFRLFYSVIATLGLIGLLLLAASLPPDLWIDSGPWLRYFGLVLATFGVLLIRLAFRQYALKPFLGFATDEGNFKREGILQHVRHPLYSGTILLVLGYVLFVPTYASLTTAGCIFLYLPIGIWLEERKLLRHFGDAYQQYRAEVPALVPRWPWR